MFRISVSFLIALFLFPDVSVAQDKLPAGMWAPCDTRCTIENGFCLKSDTYFELVDPDGLTTAINIYQTKSSLTVEAYAGQYGWQSGNSTPVILYKPGDGTEILYDVIELSSSRWVTRAQECEKDCEYESCRMNDSAPLIVGLLQYLLDNFKRDKEIETDALKVSDEKPVWFSDYVVTSDKSDFVMFVGGNINGLPIQSNDEELAFALDDGVYLFLLSKDPETRNRVSQTFKHAFGAD